MAVNKKPSQKYTEDFMKWQDQQYLPHAYTSPTESLAKYANGKLPGKAARYIALFIFILIIFLTIIFFAYTI